MCSYTNTHYSCPQQWHTLTQSIPRAILVLLSWWCSRLYRTDLDTVYKPFQGPWLHVHVYSLVSRPSPSTMISCGCGHRCAACACAKCARIKVKCWTCPLFSQNEGKKARWALRRLSLNWSVWVKKPTNSSSFRNSSTSRLTATGLGVWIGIP